MITLRLLGYWLQTQPKKSDRVSGEVQSGKEALDGG